jgi:hypothetical protein
MKRGKLFLTLITWTFLFFGNIEIPKKAFRMYEKRDLVKTVEALEKSLAKDSLNPGAHYLYALLYTDTAYVNYQVDSAYKSINRSIRQYAMVSEPKDLASLLDFQIDSIRLELKKDEIDSLKFDLVKALHTVDDYNKFLVVHSDANQFDEAIQRRDHLAFEEAMEMNIWQSYKSYMEEYPQSLDYPLADSLYKLLIYQDLTEDRTLKSYEDFLESYPQSPYRPEIEREIFQFRTAPNTVSSYLRFLEKYPNNHLAKKSLNRLYHLYKESRAPSDFLSFFNIPSQRDSIENIISLEQGYWLPKIESGRYSFIDSKGKDKLISLLNQLPDSYFCEAIETDFIYGLRDGLQQIQGRNGRLIFRGDFDRVEDLGYGFLKIVSKRGERLIHKSGEIIIEDYKDGIEVLSNSFIRVEQGGFYGLVSINGLPYLDTEFSKIEKFGNYLWLEKEEGITLIKPEALFPLIEGIDIDISFDFTDLDMLENGRIWAEKNDQEGILSQELEEIVPFGQYEIYDEAFGWKLIGEKTKIIHDGLPELEGIAYDEVLNNDRWLALEKDSVWTLYDQLNLKSKEVFDQIELLGLNMVLLERNDSTWVQFKNAKRLFIGKQWQSKLLVPQNYIQSGQPAVHCFFMLTNSRKYSKIYNEFGREIIASTYRDVTAIAPNMVRLQKRNTALIDSTGNYLLDFIYDALGSNENGYLSILDAGKVGIINPEKKLLIRPKYTKLIEPYSDSILVANEGQFKGFIDHKNTKLSSFDFDEVRYWSDTIALVRIEEEWLFHDIKNEEALYEGLLDYSLIAGKAGHGLFKVKTETGEGIYDSAVGEIIEPTYDQVKVLGTPEEPIFFALKIVEEAELYVVIYFDQEGNKLFTQSLSREAYFKIACK